MPWAASRLRALGKRIAYSPLSSFPIARVSGPPSLWDAAPNPVHPEGFRERSLHRGVAGGSSRTMPPRMLAPRRTLLWPCLIALAACGRDSIEVAASVPQQNTVPQSPPALTHDFGSIPHGEVRMHDFVLDVRQQIGEGWYSPGTHVDCSCARTELWLRSKDGSERQIAIYSPDTAPRDGESLVIRTILDTSKREAVDTKDLDSRVLVVLQRTSSRDPQQRVMWPLQFRFRIDAPVRVRPVATIDFERVAPAKPRRITLNLSSDLPERAVAFRNP